MFLEKKSSLRIIAKHCNCYLYVSVPSKHCKQDPIYLFPEMKLRGLILNFHIRGHRGNKQIPHRYMTVGIENEAT
jgi:hypothetical protein